MIANNGNHGEGKTVWPSFETASRLYNVANAVFIFSLVVGVVATVLLVWMGNIKEAYLRRDVASAGERAELANERAVALEHENLELKVEYERLKSAVAWRAVAPDQLPLLKRLLGAHVATVQLELVRGDPESQRLGAQLWAAFRGSGWNVVLKQKTPLGAAAGIWVLPNATPGESTTAAVECVRGAFREIGLPYASKGGPAMEPSTGETWGPKSPPVKVIVGSKPEPEFPE